MQNLRSRRLPFQSLALFGEQPGVLDGNDRLVGEGAGKRDLSLGERLDMLAREDDHADHGAFAHERHTDLGMDPAGVTDSVNVFSDRR